MSAQPAPARPATAQPATAPPATAQPATAPPATAQRVTARPDAARRRFALRTYSLLRLSRGVAALACLIAGLVGASVLGGTSSSLDEINRGTQQVLRLQQIKGDVLRADGLATDGLAQGTPASAITDYTAALTEAAHLTVDASEAQPLDQGGLTAVNAGLLTYALTMERARTAYPKDNAAGLGYVTDAGTVLTDNTVPALDKLVAANQSRVDAARATDRLWAAGLALVPVLLLLGLSVLLARRTRRVVNIGLLVALAASVLLWQLVDSNLAQSAAVVDSARAGSLQTATAAATAYSKLAEAKSVEGRELLQPSGLATLEPQWTAAVGDATAAVAKLGSSSQTIAAQVSAYSTGHRTLVTLLGLNRVSDARAAAANTTTGVAPSYRAASDALRTVFSDATAATGQDMSKQQDALGTASVLAVLLGALGAGASWVGLGLRLREYR